MNIALPKYFTRFAALAAFVMLTLNINAQCTGSFTYTAAGNTVTFDGMVSPAPSQNAQYYWWFSDNNQSSSLQDPTHTFTSAGTYVVCFSVYDVQTNCMDSVCQSVVVGGGCSADFTWIDSMGYFFFQGTSTLGAGGSYIWDFGDGNFSYTMNPTHTYANAGTYTVCLSVFDSLQNFCDSTCYTVTVQGSGCNADFTYIDSLGYVFFISSSTLGSGGYYSWDFGDNTYSNVMNPSHVYALPGVYLVCLFVYDSMQNFCDSTCYYVQVNSVGVNEQPFIESLNASPNPADESLAISFLAAQPGIAQVSFYDATGRLAQAQNFSVTTTGINRTEINTTHLPQGIYLMKIAVNGSVGYTRIAITHQ